MKRLSKEEIEKVNAENRKKSIANGMGILGELDAEDLEELNDFENSFHPISLTEGNVDAMFKRCLAKTDDPEEDILPIALLFNDYGFIDEDSPIKFSKKAIEKDTASILYLFGQLRDVHGAEDAAEGLLGCRGDFNKASVRYDNVQWTVDANKILMLFYLAQATRMFFIFNLLRCDKDGHGLTYTYTDGKTTIDKHMYNIALEHNRPYKGFELKLCYKDDTKTGDPVWVSSESDGNIYYVCIGAVKPTLRPSDSNYESWWAEHKDEWID